jgi:hypothetical protein
MSFSMTERCDPFEIVAGGKTAYKQSFHRDSKRCTHDVSLVAASAANRFDWYSEPLRGFFSVLEHPDLDRGTLSQ